MSASWNMAYVGEKRSGRFANFNPFPIFLGLIVFSVMILPFVMDWNEPHLQRLLIGHDLTAKEIAHQNAVDQVMAGLMSSKAKAAFGPEIGGAMIPGAEPLSGSALIAEPQQVSAPVESAPPSGGGSMANFSLSAESPPQQGFQGQAGLMPMGQAAGLSPQMAPGQQYAPDYAQMTRPVVAPTVGFNNQRFISQPPSRAYSVGGGAGASAIDYRAPRHRVVVER
jgi:hypothetical protein